MLGAARIGRSAASKAAKNLAGPSFVRSLSTTQLVAQKHSGVDRTQSTAFIRKEGAAEKKLRSGTSTSVSLDNANPEYYSEAPDISAKPLNAHSAKENAINHFVQFSKGFMESIGQNHYPGYLGSDFRLFGKPALLYRKITQTLVDRLAGYTEEGPKQASVIDGRAGAGKSAELMKLAAVAAASGHIVIYAHSTIPWVDSSQPYAPVLNSNMFSQHELTTQLLHSVLAMCEDALTQVPLGKDIVLGKKQLNATKSLADLVEFGLQTPSLSQDALDFLLDIASTQTKVPVLVAVDDVNTLWCNTAYRDQEDLVLPANRLRLLCSFLPFFDSKKTLTKGWVIGATSYLRSQFMSKDLRSKLHPKAQVPIANRELAKDPNIIKPQTRLPFEVIKLDRMSTNETWALMNFYREANVVTCPITDAFVAKKWIAANGNPREMFKSVTSYF
ncbi:hypothetical protein GGI25_002286 [Coemansia spiralis]|uniref:Small ribosomal subunit protein mS29 n=2 Tax=Coemansia TaxID=4863 RepID=A0A9W8KZ64_9FUNG|nr:mitochondrial ribosomal death-associated protein 3-domain-containing protein [Coemansia spiralis]KAJ1995270.1 hypothetical protein EDC05_001108 [Coemansia umbellata]KAJ2625672.1 hypothetical protein GGI26_000472 [Coemansia sp. RSA 1358]KAJ2678492.1 hypothetical protein GGI25_002286 [Coemansia spiralis]